MVDQPDTPDFSVVCRASDVSLDIGDSVTYYATVSGGRPPYSYDWSGDADGNSRTVTVRYTSSGTKEVTVTAEDSEGNIASDDCPDVLVDREYEDQEDDLEVICRVSDTSIEEDDSVTYTVDVNGGNSPYLYDWSGDANGSSRSVTVRYTSSGTKEVTIEVEDDDGNRASDDCPDVRVDREDDDDDDEDDLEVTCRVSDTSVRVGERVTYTADVDGGNSPYDYDWSGDVNGSSRTKSIAYNRAGTYNVEITVEDDDGNEDSDDCVVRVSSSGSNFNEDEDNGTLASIDGVYLSQLPYTGAEDTAKVIGFTSLIILWSAGVAMFLKRNKNKDTLSQRISDFKNRKINI